MTKVLLHICCGPCAIFPIQALRQEGYDVEGFFYNPNIHPYSEYQKRLEAVSFVCDRIGIPLIHHRYDVEDYLRKILEVRGREAQHAVCWQMRMEETARIARDKKIANFTTTLLSSPYQDIEQIKAIGQKLSRKDDLQFLVRNFRASFADSHKVAREWKLYHQVYCGCLFSEKESLDQMALKKKKGQGRSIAKKTILIVDDEGETALALEAILKRSGCSTDIAGNGEDALKKARETSFDLVFLDIYLPGMSGLETFRELKKINQKMKVCLMTGWPKGVQTHYEEHLSLLREGAEDKMLRKPFGKEEVLRAVNDIFSQ